MGAGDGRESVEEVITVDVEAEFEEEERGRRGLCEIREHRLKTR